MFPIFQEGVGGGWRFTRTLSRRCVHLLCTQREFPISLPDRRQAASPPHAAPAAFTSRRLKSCFSESVSGHERRCRALGLPCASFAQRRKREISHRHTENPYFSPIWVASAEFPQFVWPHRRRASVQPREREADTTASEGK